MSASVVSDMAETRGDVRPARIKLPKIDERMPALAETVPAEEARNPIYDLLVQGETDVIGLLAYSLYKQNKRDWLIAFQATHGRDPGGAETDAFILGERIPRRIATYRRLAEDMLDKGHVQGASLLSGLVSAPANDLGHQRPLGQKANRPTITWRYIGTLLAALVVMAIVFRLAAAWLFGPR
jgi:hypothetical protein